jgi:hypothetical protein
MQGQCQPHNLLIISKQDIVEHCADRSDPGKPGSLYRRALAGRSPCKYLLTIIKNTCRRDSGLVAVHGLLALKHSLPRAAKLSPINYKENNSHYSDLVKASNYASANGDK